MGCRKIRQQTFPISGVRLFTYRLSDMDGYCSGNVRPEQTECTRTVRTQDMEKSAALFCDNPFYFMPKRGEDSHFLYIYVLHVAEIVSRNKVVEFC